MDFSGEEKISSEFNSMRLDVQYTDEENTEMKIYQYYDFNSGMLYFYLPDYETCSQMDLNISSSVNISELLEAFDSNVRFEGTMTANWEQTGDLYDVYELLLTEIANTTDLSKLYFSQSDS